MRLLIGALLCILVGGFHMGTVQAEDEGWYQVETILCRIEPGVGRGELEHEADTSQRDHVEEILDNQVGLIFEDIHLRELLEFITNTYSLNIMLDNRVVQPPKNQLQVSSEADLLQGDPEDAEYVTDGVIPFINLQDVSLRNALTAILRPLNLAYRVEDTFVWVSSPQKLKEESFNDFRTELKRERVLMRTKGMLYLFDGGRLRLGKSGDMNRSLDRLMQYEGFSLIGSPSVSTVEGKPCSISTMQKQSLEYLKSIQGENDKHYFVLSTQDVEVGTAIEMTLRKKSDRELFFDGAVRTSYVDEREPIPGSTLDVGKPKVVEVEREVEDVLVQPNLWFAMLMNTPDDSILLMLIRIKEGS